MEIKEWLDGNQLGVDIWTNKYQYNNETFEQWLDRVSAGDEEDIEKAKEIARINKEADIYCDSFRWECQGCKVKEFKDRYRRFGRMTCSDVFRYLKEKGEI